MKKSSWFYSKAVSGEILKWKFTATNCVSCSLALILPPQALYSNCHAASVLTLVEKTFHLFCASWELTINDFEIQVFLSVSTYYIASVMATSLVGPLLWKQSVLLRIGLNAKSLKRESLTMVNKSSHCWSGQNQGSQGGPTGQGDTVTSTWSTQKHLSVLSEYHRPNKWIAASGPVKNNLQSV